MNIETAYAINHYIKEIKSLDKKIKWINDFIEECDNFDKGELSIRTLHGKFYCTLLDEGETKEIANTLFEYYNNKKVEIIKNIEEL